MKTELKLGHTVEDTMTPHIIRVTPTTTLQECAKKMTEKQVGSLIVTQKEKLMGIFTEHDLVRNIIHSNLDPAQHNAAEIMQTNIITTSPKEDISSAIQKMRDHNIKHLPVKKGKKIIGIITIKDIIQIHPDMIDKIHEKTEIDSSKRDTPYFNPEDNEYFEPNTYLAYN